MSGARDPVLLGSGTADSTTYLRGDGTWQSISSLGSGGIAYRSTTQAANSSTDTPIQFATVQIDDSSYFNLGTDNTKIYINAAGIYCFHGSLVVPSNPGTAYLHFQKDGAYGGNYITTNFTGLLRANLSGMFYFTTTGYVKFIYYSSGGVDPDSACVQVFRIR